MANYAGLNSSLTIGNKNYNPAPLLSATKKSTTSSSSGGHSSGSGRHDSNATVTLTELKPKFSIGKSVFSTYKGSDGNYYYKSGNQYLQISDSKDIKNIEQNKNKTYSSNATMTKFTDKRLSGDTVVVKPTTSTKSNSGSSSYSGGGSSSASTKGLEKQISDLKEEITTLAQPKVYTSDELAELYGVKDQYNYDKILQMYNDATDKYYTDAINTQRKINAENERSNSGYANSLLNAYVNGYANAAPTAVGRGALAANALSTMLGADQANEEASTDLNTLINSYKEQWEAERANNATNARTDYNNLGQWLLQQGANMNTADVQNYVNSLKAYETAYTGIRNAQNTLASTAAQAYQNRAQAALANNTYNNANAMAKYYKAYYGDNNNAWQKAYQNVLNDQATKYTTTSSAN